MIGETGATLDMNSGYAYVGLIHTYVEMVQRGRYQVFSNVDVFSMHVRHDRYNIYYCIFYNDIIFNLEFRI